MTAILLVHGAWFGAACWQHVAADLAGRGLSVRCVELPGHGLDPTPPDALSQTDTDSLVPRFWRQEDPAAWSPAWIDDAGLIDVFCADAPPEVQQVVRASHRPEALAPLGTPVHLTGASAGVPRVYVHTRDDRAVSYGLQQRMLARAGGASAVVTLEGGHLPMLVQPLVVADLIAGVAARRERHG